MDLQENNVLVVLTFIKQLEIPLPSVSHSGKHPTIKILLQT